MPGREFTVLVLENARDAYAPHTLVPVECRFAPGARCARCARAAGALPLFPAPTAILPRRVAGRLARNAGVDAGADASLVVTLQGGLRACKEHRQNQGALRPPRRPAVLALAWCAVLSPFTLRDVTGEDFKHFDLKWRDYDSMQWVPLDAAREPELDLELRRQAALAFVALRGCSYGRCDFRVDPQRARRGLDVACARQRGLRRLAVVHPPGVEAWRCWPRLLAAVRNAPPRRQGRVPGDQPQLRHLLPPRRARIGRLHPHPRPARACCERCVCCLRAAAACWSSREEPAGQNEQHARRVDAALHMPPAVPVNALAVPPQRMLSAAARRPCLQPRRCGTPSSSTTSSSAGWRGGRGSSGRARLSPGTATGAATACMPRATWRRARWSSRTRCEVVRHATGRRRRQAASGFVPLRRAVRGACSAVRCL